MKIESKPGFYADVEVGDVRSGEELEQGEKREVNSSEAEADTYKKEKGDS